jgi:hypothetical protein
VKLEAVDGWKGIFAAVSADPGFFSNFPRFSGPYLGMDIFGVHEMSVTMICALA